MTTKSKAIALLFFLIGRQRVLLDCLLPKGWQAELHFLK